MTDATRPRAQFHRLDGLPGRGQYMMACSACGDDVDREDCERCAGDGVTGHSCGEDTCCCADPEDNVPCDSCGGTGAHWKCPTCGYIHPPKDTP